MEKTDRFASLAEVQAEKQRLLAVRERSGDRLQQHWDALREPEVRGALMQDVAGDILRSWKPLHALASLFGVGNSDGKENSNGAFASSLFGAAISGGSWGKRMFRLALNLALPMLLKRAGNISFETIADEVQVTMDRVREHFRARKAEPAQYGDDDDE